MGRTSACTPLVSGAKETRLLLLRRWEERGSERPPAPARSRGQRAPELGFEPGSTHQHDSLSAWGTDPCVSPVPLEDAA